MVAIAVIGGAGFIGRQVVATLVEAGHCVTAPAQEDFDIAREPPALLAAKLKGAQIVVNCAGLARDSRVENLHGVNAEGAKRLALACRLAGVERFIHLSALGAEVSDATRFQRSKGEGEQAIRAVAGLRSVIVRPSLVLGSGGASGDFFAALAALPIPPRFERGEWRVQPLHVLELAELIKTLAFHPDPPEQVDAVGPKPITTDELTRTLRNWLGLSSRPALALPRRLLELFAFANEIVEMGPGDRDLLDLLERGNVGDPASIAAALGRAPLTFEQSLARRPATIADVWRARLYFLQPLLRLTLALLWLGTGIVSFGLYPPAEFYVMLGELGLTGPAANVALFGVAAVNCGLGALMLVNWRVTNVAQAMLALLAIFTAAALMLPHEYWLTPFAPLLKNLPIGAALLALISMERPSRQAKAKPFGVPASAAAALAAAR